MKPRVRLSDEQLRKADELKIRGASWSAIGRELSVHRQIAKREHEAWEKLQGIQELKTVRREVAAAEFGRHLADLVRLGDHTADRLESIPQTRKAFVERPLFDSAHDHTGPAQQQDGDSTTGVQGRQRFPGRRTLRGRWLFEGLEAHLRGTEWTALVGELQRVRRMAVTDLGELSRRAFLEEAVVPSQWEESDQGRLADQLLDMLWASLVRLATLTDLPSSTSDVEWEEAVRDVQRFTDRECLMDWLGEKISARQPQGQRPRLDTDGREVVPDFTEFREAVQIQKAVRQLLNALLLSGQSRRLHSRLLEALRIIQRMTAQLDELRLRPVLLRTRCELCPV